MKPLVEFALTLAAIYLALGGLFAAAFQGWGLRRLDTGAVGAGIGFRLLITPGVIALWPFLALRWHRLAQGRSFLGNQETPVSSRRLRALHRFAWQALAVSVPLVVAAALWWRPALIPRSPLASVSLGEKPPR
ncbi:MAG TPA: hypothetical protein PLX89_07385 [Verrucomicrobiota bacterium]|nr:hypothetical protein [Verrucomicrobiales bacterium]HRI12812.1 hypothetical protein [Verrucomicrobiota bacterium]